MIVTPKTPKIIPQVSIDCVVFGFYNNVLKILLLKLKTSGYYALPGGFILQNEDIDDAAQRILEERTGVKNLFLEQFSVFGKCSRSEGPEMKRAIEIAGIKDVENHWLSKRFISIGYFALTDFTKVLPTPDSLAESCEWYDIENVPPLMMDHTSILAKALEALRKNLDEKVAFSQTLMPELFTISDLQKLYETILGTPLVRTNFQRKILNMNILDRVDKKITGAANKAPYLYKFKK